MPELDSFSKLSERASRALPARNLINEWEIRAACKLVCDERLRYLEGPQKQAIEKWVMGAARKHLIRSLPVEKVSASFEGAPEWVERALAAGQTVERAILQGENHNELGHVVDWLLAHPQRQLSKLSFAQAAQKTKAWDASVQKAAARQEDAAGIEGLVEAPSMGFGWRWVEVKSKASLAREGALMRHCVGSYADWVDQGKCRIVSLRDANNKPRLTVELGVSREPSEGDGGELKLLQIRGVCNRPPETEEAPALRELIVALVGSGARLTGGRELSASGGFWQEAQQRFDLLCDLPEGASFPDAAVTLGARSGKIAANLTLGEVTIEAIPEEGLPVGLRAKGVTVAGSGAYDLRGWRGDKLRAGRGGFESLLADGFDSFECEGWVHSSERVPEGSYGYGARSRGTVTISNAREAKVADQRFESLRIEADSIVLRRAGARSARLEGGKEQGELRALDCAFGELSVNPGGGPMEAFFEHTRSGAVRIESGEIKAVHALCDYGSFSAAREGQHLSVGSTGAIDASGEEQERDAAALKSALREGVADLSERIEKRNAEMIFSDPKEAAEQSVLSVSGPRRLASAARFFAEAGAECPTVFASQGSGRGVCLDYASMVEIAESVASKATKTARLALSLWVDPSQGISDEAMERLLAIEPFDQIGALGARARPFCEETTVARALAALGEIPEALQKLGVRTPSFIDSDGVARPIPLAKRGARALAQLRELDESGWPAKEGANLAERYSRAASDANEAAPGAAEGLRLSATELLAVKELMWRWGVAHEANDAQAKSFARELLAESQAAPREPIKGMEGLMSARCARDRREMVEKPGSMEEIKILLTRAGAACHTLGWAAGDGALAREALAEWLVESSKKPGSPLTQDEAALREAAGRLLPPESFEPGPARLAAAGARAGLARGALPEWAAETVEGFCAELSPEERLALAESLEPRVKKLGDGALKALAEAAVRAGLQAEAGEVAGAPASSRELEERCYQQPTLALRWAREHGEASARLFAQSIGSSGLEDGLEELEFFRDAAAIYCHESVGTGVEFLKSLTLALMKEKLLPDDCFVDAVVGGVALAGESRRALARSISASKYFGEASRSHLITAITQYSVERPAASPAAAPGPGA